MRRTFLLILALLIPPAAGVGVSRLVEWSRYPRRFAEVAPAQVFRGGFPSRDEIAQLHRDKGIRSIVSLTDLTDRKRDRAMILESRKHNITMLRFPMPGNGRGDFDMMDRAAEAIADPRNQPVFFHCAAGKQRSNAVQAAYRLRYCGWSLDAVREELVQDQGLDLADPGEAELWRHIEAYAAHLGKQESGRDHEARDPQ